MTVPKLEVRRCTYLTGRAVTIPAEPTDLSLDSPVANQFSLTRGGPLYRLQRRLGADTVERIRVVRRALLATLITWLPLLILSLVQGVAYGRQLNIPFLRDYAANVRFLIALPLLIIAETGIDNRLRGIVVHFLKSGLVQGPELASFEAVIARVTTLRDRVLPEVVILVVAYLPSLSIRGMEMLMSNTSTWHTVQDPPANP